MKTKTLKLEKGSKNSLCYQEVPEDGMPPVIGSIYLQKLFAGDSMIIEVTIEKKG